MELNITELRKSRRPLWMTELDIEAGADMLGGGGDIYTDRLPIDWARNAGEEAAEDEQARELLEGKQAGEDYVS